MFFSYYAQAEAFELTIYTEHFSPYNFENKAGQLVGINLDIVKDVCIASDIKCDFQMLPWKRAYSLVQKKEHSGIISIAKTAERAPIFNWVGPLASSQTFFYKLKKNTNLKMNNLNDAKQFSLAIVRGDIYESIVKKVGFESGKNLLAIGDEMQYMHLFLNSKIDLILGSEYTIGYQLSPFGYSEDDVVRLQELPLPEIAGNYIAFNKSVPNYIVERFNREFEKLKKKDNFSAYKKRYKR
ncbi:transporter substrate-binding domain-containing protein [Pseudoalteromonas sp. SG45-3]|nr:transporter substrate-binding domain-containing protein [Pseudoalteromonas sp. SG45-3]MBB1357553.1 transporter substrate-binding domain-containing protein [Pseudoalteromonas sp. SG45-6]